MNSLHSFYAQAKETWKEWSPPLYSAISEKIPPLFPKSLQPFLKGMLPPNPGSSEDSFNQRAWSLQQESGILEAIGITNIVIADRYHRFDSSDGGTLKGAISTCGSDPCIGPRRSVTCPGKNIDPMLLVSCVNAFKDKEISPLIKDDATCFKANYEFTPDTMQLTACIAYRQPEKPAEPLEGCWKHSIDEQIETDFQTFLDGYVAKRNVSTCLGIPPESLECSGGIEYVSDFQSTKPTLEPIVEDTYRAMETLLGTYPGCLKLEYEFTPPGSLHMQVCPAILNIE